MSKRTEVLKDLYQFLHEICHGMYGDNVECVKDAQKLLIEMEGHFIKELIPYD